MVFIRTVWYYGAYGVVHLSTHAHASCMHDVISPPLIMIPPNKNKLGGNTYFYYRHDYPLINDEFWFDPPPS